MRKLLISAMVVLFFIACQNQTSTEQERDTKPPTINSESLIDNEEVSENQIDEVVADEEESDLTDIEEEEVQEEVSTETKAPIPTKSTKETSSTKTPVKSTATSKPKTTTTTQPTKPAPKKTTTTASKPTSTKTKTAPKKEVAKPKPSKPALSHSIWDGLLRKYVSSNGNVNYSGLVKEKAKLKEYTDLLAANPPQSSWSRNKAMAYWINAYNAFTVQLIVDNYPISSIMKLDGGSTWQVKRIKIGGKSYSLNQIEKDLLLKKYKEPRVHFAVNCAAKSCPALLNRAWTSSNLEANFEKMTKKFVNNTQFNQISKKSLKLSQIFEWYASDFGDVRAFVDKYSDVDVSSKAKISYIPYNWELNK